VGDIEEVYGEEELYEESTEELEEEDEEEEKKEEEAIEGPWPIGTIVWTRRKGELWWPAEVANAFFGHLLSLLTGMFAHACVVCSSQIKRYTSPEGATGLGTICIVDFFGVNRVRYAPSRLLLKPPP
jgi:hypothetical protein